MRTIFLFLLSLLGSSSFLFHSTPSPTPAPSSLVSSFPILLAPVSQFKSRITRKYFGTYITPQKSPVSPEKFTGYHTGVDVEYSDISEEVSVNAVYSGKIIYSGWVSGYGGLVAQQIVFQNQNYVVVYGHLSPVSLISINTPVFAGQKIGILGQGYSSQTDGERRHLHLAFLKGNHLNLLGYVKTQSELSTWTDPLTLIP